MKNNINKFRLSNGFCRFTGEDLSPLAYEMTQEEAQNLFGKRKRIIHAKQYREDKKRK